MGWQSSVSTSPSWTQYQYHAFCSILIFVILLSTLPRSIHLYADPDKILEASAYHKPRDVAANATLGFEKLYALSVRPSWRTRGLHAAAALTGLDFTIPPQPHNNEDFVNAFQQMGADAGRATPKHGSAIAWLAHVDMLKYVIGAGVNSAFIVEDDVDWDVRLLDQMQLVSDNIRAFLRTKDDDPSPFGRGWDVLWLGHCGEVTKGTEDQTVIYEDDSRCETELYSGWSKQFLRRSPPEGHRALQNAVQPVCTFGYGITKESAQRILTLQEGGADEAYDVSLSHHCATGALRCITVNPQLMNHYEPAVGHGYLSPVHEGDGMGESAEDSGFEYEKGTTGNIMRSARCKALFDDVCMRPPSEM